MLETEEVDDDFFTPSSNTSLANIFTSSPQHKKVLENETLKYTPPKPADTALKPTEDTKTTECVFACAVNAYVWAANVYTAKRLGFAIVKIIKSNIHNILLYDSNKTTVSSATITPKLEVTVKGNLYISYYDNLQSYWSLCGKEQDMNKVVETLQKLDVTIKYLKNPDEGVPSDKGQSEDKEHAEVSGNKTPDKKNESDTDSTHNKKTKASILNRMASMGHSVLPPQTIQTEKTSDSSDTTEAVIPPKARHKPIKALTKRFSSVEKNVSDVNLHGDNVEKIKALSPRTEQFPDTPNLLTLINGQLVPVTNTSVLATPSSSGNEMSLFFTEQRISNSELRINLNRTSDKVDQILEKLQKSDLRDSKSIPKHDFQFEVMQKLLIEYESKIIMYENMIKEHGMSVNHKDSLSVRDDMYKTRIMKLERLILENNTKIYELTEACSEKNCEKEKMEKMLQEEIKNLRSSLEQNEIELTKHKDNYVSSELKEPANKVEDTEFSSKLKSVMNDTFKEISANFNNDENYTGESVKNLIGSIIKQVTMKSLNENDRNK